MIKVRLAGKTPKTPLRPLTEKEIQQRLYGPFQTEKRSNAGEAPELFNPLGGEGRLSTLLRQKFPFSFDGRKIAGSLGKTLREVLNFIKSLSSKIGKGGWLGVLIVGGLLLGVHWLNGYREKAMKSPGTQISPPLRHSAWRSGGVDAPLTDAKTLEERTPPVVLSPPVEPKPPVVVPEKPYVIQVVTYAREEDARRVAEQMIQAQFPAFFQPLRRSNGKTFYAVFLGRFQTVEEAQAKLREFRGKPFAQDFTDSFVRFL